MQNSADLYVEHYWEYLDTNMERPDNLHNIKRLLRAVTWNSICSAYSLISDGHIVAKRFVQSCIFLVERCTRNPTHAFWLAREQFENELISVDVSEDWTKVRKEFYKYSGGAMEHPNLFADLKRESIKS